MATTFNFTVRAEDDQGAYADRDFSMTVRNTMIDRFMMIDATDAYTSPDMVTWTKRVGQGGINVRYGGGKWLIKTGTFSSATYRLSNDGVIFSNHTVSIPGHSGFTFSTLPEWHNDRWIAAGMAQLSGVYWVFILQSLDGINWETIVSWSYSTQAVGDYVSMTTHEGKIYWSMRTTSVYAVIDIAAKTHSFVTPSYPSVAAVGASPMYSTPRKINDLWIVMVSGSNGSMLPLYSSDLVSWSAGSLVATTYGANKLYDMITYYNGKLVASGFLTTTTTNAGYHVLLSVDGKTWTAPTTPPPSSGGQSTVGGSRQSIVSAKGNLYSVFNKIGKSTDLGVNWSDDSANYPIALFAITGFATIQ